MVISFRQAKQKVRTTMKSILVLVAFICCVTGLTVLNERIIGDTGASPPVDNTAPQGLFPYVVSVIDSAGRHICGGFIYNEQWIVTAASCVSGKSSSTIKVVVGQLSLVEEDIFEKTIAVNTISINPEYDATVKRNDIALVKLVETLDFTVGKYIFLKYDELIDPNTPELFIMGWGESMEGGSESLNLRFANVDAVEVTTDVSCKGYETNKDFFIPSMICAKASAAGTTGSPCSRDVGSPLVYLPFTPDGKTTVAYGIMSKTPSCSLESSSVYTRLSNYYFWLTQIAGPQPSTV